MKIILENLYKGIRYLKHYGFKEFLIRIKEKSEPDDISYQEWFKKHKISLRKIESQKIAVQRMETKPLISFLVAKDDVPITYWEEMKTSIKKQTYDNWEICAENSLRRAFEMAKGEYVGIVEAGDVLEPNALFEVVNELLAGADMVYTDEDKVLEDLSEYYAPHFKPDFSIDLLRSNNYITHFTVVKKSLVDEIGSFDAQFDGAQDYDFILRCIEKAQKIVHVPKVLYHWRMHEGSTAANQESKTYAFDAGARAVQAHLDRIGVDAKVETTEILGFYRVKYALKGNPLVSIIIPNKDNIDSLDLCLKSIAKSTYKNYEVIVVENNSTDAETFEYYETLPEGVQVVTWESNGVFNYSAINNYGAKFAKGEYLLLLNNDIEILTPDWLEEMVSTCQREEVGIVGARLFYPDDTIQHAGIVVGIGGHARGIASNMFVGLRKVKDGYLHKSAIQLNYSAVTAACLMVKRCVFDEVDGLTETLAVAFNDVDFCLKVREKGYLVCYNPYVVAYHYESKSRGSEDSPEKQKRFHSEIDYMREHWNEILRKGDPYYNINLSRVKNDYTLGSD